MNTKRIILFCCKNEINNINYYISKKFKNSLINYKYEENEYYFSSKNGNVEKININIVVLQFNKRLADSICEILKWSYSQSQSIVNEHTGLFNEPEYIQKLLITLIYVPIMKINYRLYLNSLLIYFLDI